MTPWHRRLLAASAAIAGLLAGCSGAARHGTTLEFWTIGSEGEAVTQLLPEFEREHPDIRVDVQQIPLTASHEKLLTAYAGGSLPDVTQLGDTWIPEFAALHALEPLQSRVEHSAVIRKDDYFASVWATSVIDKVLVGIPWYVDTRLLFYRTDLLRAAGFDAPPRDWAEWQAQMDAIRAHSGGRRWGALLPVNEYDQLLALALQQHVPLLRDGGRYVFYLSGPWNIGEFRRRLPASRQSGWSTAPLPGPDGPGDSVAYGSSLVILRGSRHKDAAWKLLEYLSRPDVQVRFYRLLGDLPARRSAWDSPLLEGDPELRAFREQLERMRPAPQVPEWEQIVNMMQDVAARAIAGQLTVDQAAAQMDQQANAILAKRRWVLARQAPSLQEKRAAASALPE